MRSSRPTSRTRSTIIAVKLSRLDQAQRAGFATVVSARSGETEQDGLADLAIGWRAGQIKVGSLTRSERTAKWNRLLRIESDPQELVSFAGWSVPRP